MGVGGIELAELSSSTVSLVGWKAGHVYPYHASGVCGGERR